MPLLTLVGPLFYVCNPDLRQGETALDELADRPASLGEEKIAIPAVIHLTWRWPDPSHIACFGSSSEEVRAVAESVVICKTNKRRNMIPIWTRTTLGRFASARSQLHVLDVRLSRPPTLT